MKELLNLWAESFGEVEYAKKFYEVCNIKNILTKKNNNEIISVLHYLPCYYVDDKRYEGYYLYALSTAKKHRGCGNMGELINEILKKADEEGKFVFLSAADKKLCEYYKHFGFEEIIDKPMCARKIVFEKEIIEFVEWENEKESQNGNRAEIILPNQMIYGGSKDGLFTGLIPY